MFAGGARQNLRVRETRIKSRIEACYVFPNEEFKHALRLRSKHGVPCVGSQRMAVLLKFMEEFLDCCCLSRLPHGLQVPSAKINSRFVPTQACNSAKPDHDLFCRDIWVERDVGSSASIS